MKRKTQKNILWFEEITKDDVALVGGKNASLGEMFSKLSKKRINVPEGFALTSNFYWKHVKENNLQPQLKKIFSQFNPQSLESLQETGQRCRLLFSKSQLSPELKDEIAKDYRLLSKKSGRKDI